MTRRHKILLLTGLYARRPAFRFLHAGVAGAAARRGAVAQGDQRHQPAVPALGAQVPVAPFVDHYGTRRQWLLPLQLAAVAGALLLTQVDLSRGYLAVLAAAFLFNLVAACQDVATDGLAVRILDARERGSPTASRSAPTASA